MCGQISFTAPEWTNEETGLYGSMYWLPGNKSITSWSAPSSLHRTETTETDDKVERNDYSTPTGSLVLIV